MPNKKPSSRVIAFDLLRGYFLVAIILDHLNYWPNGLDWVTARGSLFVSAAEGFFLISGIVLGIVRGRKLLEKPFVVGAWLLLKRGLQLYITYAILTLFFTLIGLWFFANNPGVKAGLISPDTSLLGMIWQVLSFQYLYGWADYLRLYCIFLFISPLVLLLLRKKLWWLVLLVSTAVFTFSPSPDYPANILTQPYHWQIIFFGGMVIGFHWQDLVTFWQRQSHQLRLWTITTVVSLTIVTILTNSFLSLGGLISPDVGNFVTPIHNQLAPFFDKENLSWWRLALFGLWFSGSLWFFMRFEKAILHYLGWLLLPFGINSLYVYTVHAFLIFFVHLLIPTGGSFFLLNLIISVATIAIVRVMIQYKVLFKVIPR